MMDGCEKQNDEKKLPLLDLNDFAKCAKYVHTYIEKLQNQAAMADG
jgi:hypothetical protein